MAKTIAKKCIKDYIGISITAVGYHETQTAVIGCGYQENSRRLRQAQVYMHFGNGSKCEMPPGFTQIEGCAFETASAKSRAFQNRSDAMPYCIDLAMKMFNLGYPSIRRGVRQVILCK